MCKLEIDLPTPLSVNKTRRIDWRSMGDRKKWKQLADAMLFTQWRQLKSKAIKGRFEAQIILPESYRGDLDNVCKGVIDLLVAVELIPDDAPKYMRKLVVEIGDIQSGCKVVLRPI